jgi:hypothetical protein
VRARRRLNGANLPWSMLRDSSRNDRHDTVARQFFHEQIRKLDFIDYNGKLEIHNSSLNLVYTTSPKSKRMMRAMMMRAIEPR